MSDDHRGLVRFWVRVLSGAILDYRQPGEVGRRARQWIDGDTVGLVTYRWVCEVIGIDPDALRERVSSAEFDAERLEQVATTDRGRPRRRAMGGER